MERAKKIIADAVFVIQILIAFILIFESRIVVPALLQSFGRMHPLLLHLPIGLLLITVVFLFTRRYFEAKAIDELTSLLLHFTALTASLTTLMGMFLSLEGTFGAEQLRPHKWMGVALSFLCWGLLAVKDNLKVLKPAGLAGVVLLIFTGHFGANLTHGEDFVWAPLQEEEPRVARVITDSTSLFTAAIEPIFESKCYGCHNPKKAKGNLVLTSLENIMKGGESGALWKPADASGSLLVERLLLPIDHDDHMPPKDKAQLTEDEITFISMWIDSGANTGIKLNEVAADDTLGKLASIIVPRYQQVNNLESKYSFEFASADKIQKLSTPNRTVFQIARNEPAVQAEFYLRETYDPKLLEELLAVKDQLVCLNLSKMPVQDNDLKTVSRFPNLEILNLNNTNITGAGVKQLASLPALRSASFSGTQIDASALRALGNIPTLKEVFIWNTQVSSQEIASLQKEFPKVRWDLGFVPDEKEVLKLNPPMLKNKTHIVGRNERVVLRHNLPGTVMRYTLDGSEPDSINSPEFKEGLKLDKYAHIKAKAFKDGWLSSDVANFFCFPEGIKPDSMKLQNPPDEQYPGEGVGTLFDGKPGLASYYKYPAWIAYKEKDLILDFSFEKEIPTIKNLTLSYAHHNSYMCLPPDVLQLWGGNEPANLKLIKELNPPETSNPGRGRIEGVSMDVPASNYKYYRLVAKPTRNPADGNPRKRNLWLMVDEVFIN